MQALEGDCPDVPNFPRAVYVEFVRRADDAAIIRCHLNAFDHFRGFSGAAFRTMSRWWF